MHGRDLVTENNLHVNSALSLIITSVFFVDQYTLQIYIKQAMTTSKLYTKLCVFWYDPNNGIPGWPK